MSMESDALAALQAAAGVSASEISLTIRTILLVLVFFWAASCVYSKLHHIRHHATDLYDAQRTFFRILLVVSIAVALVFIG